jgi:hypothetical protein
MTGVPAAGLREFVRRGRLSNDRHHHHRAVEFAHRSGRARTGANACAAAEAVALAAAGEAAETALTERVQPAAIAAITRERRKKANERR